MRYLCQHITLQWTNHKTKYLKKTVQWTKWKKCGWGPEEPLTLGLLDTRSDTTQEIIRRHKYLMIAMISMHLQGCKVSKNLVWSWILSDTVLILNDLEIMMKLAWVDPLNTAKDSAHPPSALNLQDKREHRTHPIYQNE